MCLKYLLSKRYVCDETMIQLKICENVLFLLTGYDNAQSNTVRSKHWNNIYIRDKNNTPFELRIKCHIYLHTLLYCRHCFHTFWGMNPAVPQLKLYGIMPKKSTPGSFASLITILCYKTGSLTNLFRPLSMIWRKLMFRLPSYGPIMIGWPIQK